MKDQKAAAPAGFPGMPGGMPDMGSMGAMMEVSLEKDKLWVKSQLQQVMQNPQMRQMAESMLQNPQYQNMMQNMFGGKFQKIQIYFTRNFTRYGWWHARYARC